MLPELPADIQAALDLGVSIFAGEAENRMDDVLRDAVAGKLRPVYDFLKDLPDLAGAVAPFLPVEVTERYMKRFTSIDAGRGCPFACSFCTIINVQGKKSRHRTPDDVADLVRMNYANGIRRIFITDDNFARNSAWEPILDRLAELGEKEGIQAKFTLQVDTLCHRLPGFHQEGQAGRGQPRVHRTREHQPGQPDGSPEAPEQDHRVPADAPGVARRGDLHLRRLHPRFPEGHARVDRAGHRDHQARAPDRPPRVLHSHAAAGVGGSSAAESGRDPHGLRHEQVRPRARHDRSSEHDARAGPARLRPRVGAVLHARAHRDPAAACRGLGRDRETGRQHDRAVLRQRAFEKVHPLQSGLFRIKRRRTRRSELPRESPFVFYPRRVWEVLSTYLPAGVLWLRLDRLRRRIERDPLAREFRDFATTPVPVLPASEHLEMFDLTPESRAVVAKARAAEQHVRAASG